MVYTRAVGTLNFPMLVPRSVYRSTFLSKGKPLLKEVLENLCWVPLALINLVEEHNSSAFQQPGALHTRHAYTLAGALDCSLGSCLWLVLVNVWFHFESLVLPFTFPSPDPYLLCDHTTSDAHWFPSWRIWEMGWSSKWFPCWPVSPSTQSSRHRPTCKHGRGCSPGQ